MMVLKAELKFTNTILESPGAGGCSEGTCSQHCLQTWWLCRRIAGVHEWVNDVFEVGQNKVLKGLNYHRGQDDKSVVIKFCGAWFFGDADNSGGLAAGWQVACLQ